MRVPLLALASLALAACGPPPPPVPPSGAPTAAPSAAPLAPPSATPVAAPTPPAPLPSLHPCVPDFITRTLHTCDPGAPPTDYSAVSNAMVRVTSEGPIPPRPGADPAVQRPLIEHEDAAADAARAFLCSAPPGEPDDEHTTVAFDVGRLYLNAHHFEEAAAYLHDAANLDPVKHPEAEYATRFLMEAVAALARTRPECTATFKSLGAAASVHICQGPGADARAESCAAIEKSRAN